MTSKQLAGKAKTPKKEGAHSIRRPKFGEDLGQKLGGTGLKGRCVSLLRWQRRTDHSYRGTIGQENFPQGGEKNEKRKRSKTN